MSGPSVISRPTFDKSWSLFLDRDGVLNVEYPAADTRRVVSWGDFVLVRGVLPALQKLSRIFGRIVIVTNQRAVGRGLMSREALDWMHRRLAAIIQAAGARLDGIYVSTDADPNHYHHKPNPGLAYLAQKDFPEICFNQSVIVGNALSDMMFGRKLGMYTVWVKGVQFWGEGEPPPGPEWADETHPSLYAWACSLIDGGASSAASSPG